MSNRSDFGTFGRFDEPPLEAMSDDQKEVYGASLQARDGLPGPQKIWLSNPKLSRVIAPVGAYYQKDSSLTKAEVEIATNIANAHWLAAYSTYVHEQEAAQAGVPAEKAAALIAGLPTSFEDPRQQVLYEIATALVAPRVVPKGLYRRGKELLGDAGLCDLATLLGYFPAISLTLRLYDVPSHAIGLKR